METLGFFGCLVEKVIKGRGVSKIEKKNWQIDSNQPKLILLVWFFIFLFPNQ